MKELVEKRTLLIAEMKALNEKAKAEARSFTEEEDKEYKAKDAEIRALTAQIDAAKREAELNGFTETLPVVASTEGRSGMEETSEVEFRSFLEDGKVEGRSTMSVTADGAVLAPKALVKEIVSDMMALSRIYELVRKVPVKEASAVDIPFETDASDAAWSAEVPNDEWTADSTWAFAAKTLTPQTLVKLLKVSKKLKKLSAIPIDQLVKAQITKKFAKAVTAGILTGRGETTYHEPLGLFVASSSGVSSSRDVTTTYTSASAYATADDFLDVVYKVDPDYRKGSVWIMSSDVVKYCRKLKGEDGQYLWQPGLNGEPNTFCGYEVCETNAAPSTVTSGSYIAVFGNLDMYGFAEVEDIEIQVLFEKFATTGQLGYLATAFKSGAPLTEKAFARLKVGS